MKNISRLLIIISVVWLCSFIAIILIFKNQPFPLSMWVWDQSPVTKWVLLGFSTWLVIFFVALLLLILFNWLTGAEKTPGLTTKSRGRFTVGNKYDVLQDQIRGLKFFLNAQIIGFVGLLASVILSKVVSDVMNDLLTRLYFFFFIIALTSMHFFFKCRWAIQEIKKDYSFMVSEGVMAIIVGNYMKANSIFKSILKKLFPSQLHNI